MALVAYPCKGALPLRGSGQRVEPCANTTVQARTEVAVAMLHRDGRWLLQLRDDLDWIIAPGCWGLFGGHLESDESPEQGLRRELVEEICLEAAALEPLLTHDNAHRRLHVFVGPLPVPIEELDLKEGQDLTLASLAEISRGEVISGRLHQARPLAGCLKHVLQQWQQGAITL